MYLLWMNLLNSVLSTTPPPHSMCRPRRAREGEAREGENPLRNFTCSIEDPKM